MANRYDVGIQQDFDNMTEELATNITVAPRSVELTYEGQEDTNSNAGTAVTDRASIVELNSQHEMVAEGQMNVGDLIVTFKANSTVEEESKITWNGATYKILSLDKPRGLQNNIITHIVGRGKKIPSR